MSTKNDDARTERLKAALRENLRRRKAQVRARDEPSSGRGTSLEDTAHPDERNPPASDDPSS